MMEVDSPRSGRIRRTGVTFATNTFIDRRVHWFGLVDDITNRAGVVSFLITSLPYVQPDRRPRVVTLFVLPHSRCFLYILKERAKDKRERERGDSNVRCSTYRWLAIFVYYLLGMITHKIIILEHCLNGGRPSDKEAHKQGEAPKENKFID
jgi:hypothetical protein